MENQTPIWHLAKIGATVMHQTAPNHRPQNVPND